MYASIQTGPKSPFGDEQFIEDDVCGKGQVWQRKILERTVKEGTLFNAYNTPIYIFNNSRQKLDCFFGGLIAAGIPPQIYDDGAPTPTSLDSRVHFWNSLSRLFGHSTESSISILHYADVFWVGLVGGVGENGQERHGPDHIGQVAAPTFFGLYAANTILVSLPPFDFTTQPSLNATVVVFIPSSVPHTNISFGSQGQRSITLFGASAATVHMTGAFWYLALGQGPVRERVLLPDGGGVREYEVFGANVTGQQSLAVSFGVGVYVTYTKTGMAPPRV